MYSKISRYLLMPIFALLPLCMNAGGKSIGIPNVNTSVPDYALKVSPNPISKSGTVTFQLHEAADVNLYLLDDVGMNVLIITAQYLGKGPHSFPFSVEDLGPGLYHCVLKIGKNRMIKKVVVSK